MKKREVVSLSLHSWQQQEALRSRSCLACGENVRPSSRSVRPRPPGPAAHCPAVSSLCGRLSSLMASPQGGLRCNNSRRDKRPACAAPPGLQGITAWEVGEGGGRQRVGVEQNRGRSQSHCFLCPRTFWKTEDKQDENQTGLLLWRGAADCLQLAGPRSRTLQDL